MKFEVVRTDAWSAEADHLLRAMLQYFRRIHAAKSGFRGHEAAGF
jgi:hypothetical protein